MDKKLKKAISNINELPKNKVEEACSLLDYVYFGNFLYFGFINGCFKKEELELFWKNITNFHGLSKQEYEKNISIYNKILNKIGITDEIYQKYSKKVMPNWEMKRLEEYVDTENKLNDIKITTQDIFNKKEKRKEFDINLADYCLPIYESFENDKYFCEMEIQDDGIVSLEVLNIWHKTNFNNTSNKEVFSWFISTKLPHLQDKVHYYQEGNTFIVIIGNLDKDFIISDAVGDRLKERLRKNCETFKLNDNIDGLIKNFLKCERFLLYSDNVENLKEIGHDILKNYDQIENDYRAY